MTADRKNRKRPGMFFVIRSLSAKNDGERVMDGKHCCVCGQELLAFDVYILRAQGKICSRCLLERGIPVGGKISRQAFWRGKWRSLPRPAQGLASAH